MNGHRGNHEMAMGASPVSAAVFACPMHPAVRSGKTGRSPECGMELSPEKPSGHGAVKHGAHGEMAMVNKHQGHNLIMFSRRFWIVLALTLRRARLDVGV